MHAYAWDKNRRLAEGPIACYCHEDLLFCPKNEGEAHLIALACSEPPTGKKHWSLRLLQERFVKLGHVDNISYETIRRVLKKTSSSPG